jgi:hypothetical protein
MLPKSLGSAERVDQTEQVHIIQALERVVEHYGSERRVTRTEVETEKQRHRKCVQLGTAEEGVGIVAAQTRGRVGDNGLNPAMPTGIGGCEREVCKRWVRVHPCVDARDERLNATHSGIN